MTVGSVQWLEKAIVINHRALFRIEAEAAGGQERHLDGLTWTFVGSGYPATISFPEFPAVGAVTILDTLMETFHREPPASAGFWSLDPTNPPDLGLLLLARGFQVGWRPHWMAMDLRTWTPDGEVSPFPDLDISADNTSDLRSVSMLPYADSRAAVKYKWDSRKSEGNPVHLQRFVAKVRRDVVGHACVLCTTGPQAVAGIYDVGVVDKARKHGIGSALVKTACMHALEHGYAYAVLNASRAGKSVYEKVGFRSFGDGWTWWLMNERWKKEPPTTREISFSEALGRADLNALDLMDISADFLSKGMTNGMGYLDLAVHQHQPEAAEWLIKKGLALMPLQAWDLGWRDRAEAILRAEPDKVNQTFGECSQTLMHTAVEREDEDLARMVLSQKPDLAIKDKIYQGTALGWAHVLGRPKMVTLLENATQA